MGPRDDKTAEVYLGGTHIGFMGGGGMKWDRWYCCPFCGKALFPLRSDTKVRHMPYRCKACKQDIEVNIE